MKSRTGKRKCLNVLYPNISGSAYIAITAAIIITILILAVVVTTSSIGYFGRFNILGSLLKEEGDALAEACADTALLELALDIDYVGAATTSVGSSTCEILAVETDGTEKTIKVRGVRDNTITNTEVILETDDFTIISWDDVAAF